MLVIQYCAGREITVTNANLGTDSFIGRSAGGLVAESTNQVDASLQKLQGDDSDDRSCWFVATNYVSCNTSPKRKRVHSFQSS